MKQTYIIPLVTPEVKLVIAARKYYRAHQHYPESVTLASSEYAKCAWDVLRMPVHPKAELNEGTLVIIPIKADDAVQLQEVVCYESVTFSSFLSTPPSSSLEAPVPAVAKRVKHGKQSLRPLEQTGAKRTNGHRGGISQKYILTDPGREIILAEYDGSSKVIDNLAERLRVPRNTIKRWGGQLGLARKKEPNWTEEDERYLESHLHEQSIAVIAATLGRTKTAVKLKAKRLGVNKTKEGYTMRGLCLALGCDHHKVEKWLGRGWLHGARRGSEHQTHDFWLFTDTDIRDFVIAHPLEIDQRRMDWLFVADLLAHGKKPEAGLSTTPYEDEETGTRPIQELLEGEMNLDTEHTLHFDIDAIAGKSMALLGISGSGKTNTAFVLIEEMLANKVPMTIVDIEGEYWTLSKQFKNIQIVGRSEHCTEEIEVENAMEIARSSLLNGTPVILDLFDYSMPECHDILKVYLQTLWMYAAKVKRPYQIVLEEAHEWIPEMKQSEVKDIVIRIALRGRKRGLGTMVVSQRSAKVSKDVLSQIEFLFLHKVVHPIDMNVYKSLVPMTPLTVERMVARLQKGQSIVICNHVPQVAQIRLKASAVISPDIKTVMRKRIKEMEEQLIEKEAIIKDQADYIARMSEAHPEWIAQFEAEAEPLCV